LAVTPYFDTSVIMSLLGQYGLSQRARVFAARLPGRVLVSDLAEAEFAAVTARR
jgi:hypothetical protein